jgi:rubrerythrin
MDTQVEETSRVATPMPKVLDGLNDLLKLDHDAIGAYEIAVAKLESQEWSDQITGFMRDHERHIRQLNELIVELGGTPANQPHATGPFKQALQSLGALAGDRGVLVAFRANELQVRMKYDRYASRANRWPRSAKELVDRNALDEERHYQWAADVLEDLGIPTTGGAEIGAATRIREGMNRLHEKVDVEEIRSDLEDRTRSQPMRMALAAFAAGFVIGRILR